MRRLVLSDVHSNLAAFEAVLADAGEFDEVWCLGDVVGYGPQPNECIDRLKSLPHLCVAGNHDWAAIDRLDISGFNPYAMRACLWTREQLSPESWEYLEDLDEVLVEEPFTIVHGSPRHPIWEYIVHESVAVASFAYFDTVYGFFGHTHVPIAYAFDPEEQACVTFTLPESAPVFLDVDRLLINPGGVGQPRDGDPRASYILLDTEVNSIEYRRVEYPVEKTQKLMRSVGLPQPLETRLSYGH
jgi:predicted phosphodiesterase